MSQEKIPEFGRLFLPGGSRENGDFTSFTDAPLFPEQIIQDWHLAVSAVKHFGQFLFVEVDDQGRLVLQKIAKGAK
jgi:hypothetical protein